MNTTWTGNKKIYRQKRRLYKRKGSCKYINLAEKNGMWKGDKVGYGALHAWVKRRLKKPKLCQCCKKNPPHDLANISGEYKRDLSDWEWLCRKCHMVKDERIKNFLQGHKGRKKKPCQICGTLTKRIKFCIKCAIKRRIEWWRKYNKSPKRKKYLKNYNKNVQINKKKL